MEGSLLGIPSFACSMSLPENNFEEIRINKGLVKGKLAKALKLSAKSCAKYTSEWFKISTNNSLEVHNLNFPMIMPRKRTQF